MPELLPLHICYQRSLGKTDIIMKAIFTKAEADLEERKTWSQKWRQRRKEERLRQQQAKFQQEASHALEQHTSKV